MGNKRASSPRAKSPPPRSTAGRSFSEDVSPNPFQKAKKPVSPALQNIEKPATQSAFAGVQDPLFLFLLVASFVVFIALEYNGKLVPIHPITKKTLEIAENSSFIFIKHVVNKHVRHNETSPKIPLHKTFYCDAALFTSWRPFCRQFWSCPEFCPSFFTSSNSSPGVSHVLLFARMYTAAVFGPDSFCLFADLLLSYYTFLFPSSVSSDAHRRRTLTP